MGEVRMEGGGHGGYDDGTGRYWAIRGWEREMGDMWMGVEEGGYGDGRGGDRGYENRRGRKWRT